jgi:hypothetical protein
VTIVTAARPKIGVGRPIIGYNPAVLGSFGAVARHSVAPRRVDLTKDQKPEYLAQPDFGFVRHVWASLVIAIHCPLPTAHFPQPNLSRSWTGAYPLRIELPDHRAVCSSDAAPRRIGRNNFRRSCHSMMAGLASGRRPEGYQGVITVKKKWIRVGFPRCQLVIVNPWPSVLRCQKHRFTRITQAVDGLSNCVLDGSIPYFLGQGRLSQLKSFFYTPRGRN